MLDYIKGRAFKEVRLEDLLQLIQDLLERLRKAEERTEEVTRSYQALKKAIVASYLSRRAGNCDLVSGIYWHHVQVRSDGDGPSLPYCGP